MNKIEKSQNKSKATWNVISEIKGDVIKKKTIEIIHENKKISSPSELAKVFNSFFIDQPYQIINNIVLGTSSKKIENSRSNPNSMFLSYVSEEDILEIINHKLKNKTSRGPDGISPQLLKDISIYIKKPLTEIINCSFIEGTFPSSLKVGKVTPVFKKGDSKNMENFRPITESSALSKIIEYAMLAQIQKFLDKFNLLSPCQHGFRNGYSTITAMEKFYGYAIECLDSGRCPTAVFCDLTRAFDCVKHTLLLDKLCKLGIRGNAFDWLKSYLLDRSQFVEIVNVYNNQIQTGRSKILKNNIGVPQGSVLGPLLFIIYINNLTDYIVEADVTLYADDATLLFSNIDPKLGAEITTTINNLNFWFNTNNLYLNPMKTQYVNFHSKQKISATSTHNINVNNTVIEKAKSVKFLGVYFDEHLTFEGHCKYLIKALNTICFQIRTLKEIFDISDLVKFYYAHVHSRLLYGLTLWGGSSHAPDVFIAQKRIIRTIMGVPSTHSCRPLFKSMGILPLAGMYIKGLLEYIHQNKNAFTTREEIHSYNTRAKKHFTVPLRKLKATTKEPKVIGLKLYNDLPDAFKQIISLNIFKKRLKKHLISICPYTMNEYNIFRDTNSSLNFL